MTTVTGFFHTPAGEPDFVPFDPWTEASAHHGQGHSPLDEPLSPKDHISAFIGLDRSPGKPVTPLRKRAGSLSLQAPAPASRSTSSQGPALFSGYSMAVAGGLITPQSTQHQRHPHPDPVVTPMRSLSTPLDLHSPMIVDGAGLGSPLRHTPLSSATLDTPLDTPLETPLDTPLTTPLDACPLDLESPPAAATAPPPVIAGGTNPFYCPPSYMRSYSTSALFGSSSRQFTLAPPPVPRRGTGRSHIENPDYDIDGDDHEHDQGTRSDEYTDGDDNGHEDEHHHATSIHDHLHPFGDSDVHDGPRSHARTGSGTRNGGQDEANASQESADNGDDELQHMMPRRKRAKSAPTMAAATEADKPFACEDCGKSFRRMEHLRRHMKVHTMERPYTCAVPKCTRKFSRSDNLKAHMLTHTKQGGRNIYVEGLVGDKGLVTPIKPRKPRK